MREGATLTELDQEVLHNLVQVSGNRWAVVQSKLDQQAPQDLGQVSDKVVVQLVQGVAASRRAGGQSRSEMT